MKRYVASHLKDMNRKLVYDMFMSQRQLSRSDISRETGISPPTVLKIVDFFLRHRLVIEDGEGVSSLGRKPQLFRFNAQAAYTVGVVMEDERLRVGVVDLGGTLHALREMRVRMDFSAVLQTLLVGEIRAALADAGLQEALILSAGLAVPGMIDAHNRVIDFSQALGIRQRFDCNPLLDAAEEALGFPIYLENDVNASAMGEYDARRRQHKPTADLVYIQLGDGLGAGIILDGQLLRGRQHAAGEIGYMVLDAAYPGAANRDGWLEGALRAQALAERYPVYERLLAGESPAGYLDDPQCTALLDELATRLSLSIVNMLAVVDVGLVVLGGRTVQIFGDDLIACLHDHLGRVSALPVQCALPLDINASVVGIAAIARELGIEVFFAD
ncbi:MAG: ROK family protein [Oscillospiraceae bacterium]|nr:ROK family protein [Oscillospiraceae bacterium]